MKEWIEYAAVWVILKGLGVLPQPLARSFASGMMRIFYALLPRLRKTAEVNLRIAFPEWSDDQRKKVVRGMLRNLGWMAAEFVRLPKYTKENIEQILVLDGHENFLEGQRRGKGVLYLTGHIGAWELSSFAHALYGFPLHYMARRIDNHRIDALVNSSSDFQKRISPRDAESLERGRNGRNSGGPEHHAGRSRVRGFFR